MVKHIVFWKLRDDCDKDDATRQIAGVLQPLAGGCRPVSSRRMCPEVEHF